MKNQTITRLRTMGPSTEIAGLILAVTLLAGCSKPAEEPMAEQRPVGLSAEQQEVVLRRGRAIAMETFDLLRTNLQTAIQAGGITNALPFCSLAASPLTAGMAAKHGVTLRRVTDKARNPSGKADLVEGTFLRGFEAALADAHGAPPPPPPVVTNLTPSVATFFAPILINHELCLKCHGEPGRDIAAGDHAVIQQLYPLDAAVGYTLGQLRGAWRIDFPLTSLPGGTATPSR